MANRSWKGITVKLDNSAGSITDITSSVNKADLAGEMELLEDTNLSAEERTYQPGLAGATVKINGFSNSTTDGIFAPLVGNRTTVTKTFKYYNGSKWWQGEVYANGVTTSGEPGQLQTWSADLTFSGAVSNTTS